MSDRTGRSALHTARVRRGWSQAAAARELQALARARAGPNASAASLKTQLSRWENGHALPDPEYRALLGELYGRSPEELGLVPTPEPSGLSPPERLRAQLAAAAAMDDGVVGLWAEQLALAGRIDDELGAAGAADLVRAQSEHLARTLAHTVSPARRGTVAGVLAGAATLAGRHALDRGDPEAAWAHFGTARSAATEAGAAAAVAKAVAGQAEALREVGAAAVAVDLLAHVEPGGPPGVEARLAAALGAVHADLGDAAAAQHEFDAARRALRPRPDAVHADGPEIADLHRWHGHALVTLHDPGAAGPLQNALDAGPRTVRHRAGLHADLAVALARAGRVEDARPHAGAARQLAERIGSLRITAQLDRSGGILAR